MLKAVCVDLLQTLTGRFIYDGPIVAISKGLHIYDHFWDAAKREIGEYHYLRYEDAKTLGLEGLDVINF